MSRPEDIAGPYIVWENHGYDGWSPTSYKTLAEAIRRPRDYEWELTLKAEWITSEDGKVSIDFKKPRPPYKPYGFPPHTEDPATGGCSVCKATREAILDNIARECIPK